MTNPVSDSVIDATDDADLPQPVAAAGPSTGIWNARREQLFGVLAARDETVADLYRRAVDGLGERPLTPGALVVASHCVRELSNRLPRVLGEVELQRYRSGTEAAAALAAALAEAGLDNILPGDDPTPEGALEPEPKNATAGGADGEHGMVLVPREVLDAARDVARAHVEGSTRAHQMRSALVDGATHASGSASTLKVVKDAVNTFERCRHPLGDDLSSWLARGPSFYAHQLEIIEQVLDSRLGRFFDVVADLNDLLDPANARHPDGQGDDWAAPDDALVARILPRIADPQHRRVFFNGLRNPRWIAALDAHRVFDDPPNHLVVDNLMPFQPWPQGDYLRAMAPEEPTAVTSILARTVHDQTAWNVREQVIRVASEVPADAAAVLVDLICASIEDRQVGPHIGLEVVEVIESLVAGSNSQRKKAKRLAQNLLAPRIKGKAAWRGRFNIGAGIDDHWYKQALDRTMTAFGHSLDIFKSTVWWLDAEQTMSGTFVIGERDSTSSRRPSVSDHPQNHRFDEVSDALIDVVRDTVIALIRADGPEPVVAALRTRPAGILRRIEMYALSQTITVNGALDYAAGHLTDPDVVTDYTFHRELHQLGAAALPHLDDTTYAQWERIVLDRPEPTEEHRDFVASLRPQMDPDAAIAEHLDHAELERLSAVGRDALRGRALARYDDLVARYGEPEHPGFLTWHSTWRGVDPDNPPPDLSSMTPDDVLDLITRSAADEHADLDQPTNVAEHEIATQRESLAHAFGAAVANEPGAYSSLAERVFTLDAPLVSRYMSALREHIRNAPAPESTEQAGPTGTAGTSDTPPEPIDWPTLLTALENTDVWRETTYDDINDYGTWRWVRDELCSLLEYAVDSTTPTALPADLLPAAFSIAAAMTTDSNPTPEAEERYSGSNADPHGHSLNTVRPSAVRTMLRIARADTRHHEIKPDTGDSTQALGTPAPHAPAQAPLTGPTLTRLTNLLEPERDHSLTIASVFGEVAGWLIGYAPDWLTQHRNQLMTPDQFGDVFVTTALWAHRPHSRLIAPLTPAIENILRRAAAGDDIVRGVRHDDSPTKLIGIHLVSLHLSGLLALDDPLLAQYFTDAPVEDRAAVFEDIAWQFSHTNDLDDDIRNSAATLWDSRLAALESGEADPGELSGFESWVRCGHFDVTWWLPRLTTLAERFNFDGRAYIEDELVAASAVDVPGTLHAIDVLVRNTNSPQTLLPYGLRQAAPIVLARALNYGDPAVTARADDLTNYIGRHGDLQIEEEVRRAREDLHDTNQPPDPTP